MFHTYVYESADTITATSPVWLMQVWGDSQAENESLKGEIPPLLLMKYKR